MAENKTVTMSMSEYYDLLSYKENYGRFCDKATKDLQTQLDERIAILNNPNTVFFSMKYTSDSRGFIQVQVDDENYTKLLEKGNFTQVPNTEKPSIIEKIAKGLKLKLYKLNGKLWQ